MDEFYDIKKSYGDKIMDLIVSRDGRTEGWRLGIRFGIGILGKKMNEL